MMDDSLMLNQAKMVEWKFWMFIDNDNYGSQEKYKTIFGCEPKKFNPT